MMEKLRGVISCLTVVCMVMVDFSPSLPLAAEAAISCEQVMRRLAPCLTFLEGSGGGMPAFGCCNGVEAINNSTRTTSDRQVACRCLKSIAESIPGIKHDNAANLPGLCNVNVPYPISFATDCDKMNKATIITDAITYIQNLQNTVEDLSDELHSLDAILKEDVIHCKNEVIPCAEQEMKECELQAEVQVTHLYGNKVWIQIISQKKSGALTKLIEAITVLGFHPQDTSVTTIKGGLLITLCVEAYHGGFIEVAKIRDFLMDTVRNM